MAVSWTKLDGYTDIVHDHSATGITRLTINRTEVHNAFRPKTMTELIEAFRRIRDDASIGVALLIGAGLLLILFAIGLALGGRS